MKGNNIKTRIPTDDKDIEIYVQGENTVYQ